MNPTIAAPTRKAANDLAKLKPRFLDLKAQFAEIREEIFAAVTGVLESQHFIFGPEVEAFEREISAHTGARFAIGCASGSDALLLALLALEIRPGDEVITTPFTFVATAGAIARIGAKPVFVDIDPATFNIDPAQIENAITPRTRAILPVHLFGMAADMDAILKIAAKRELPVIEDAAQSIGARYRGEAVGNLGAMGCFSFFPSKNLGGAGDGGMITTNDQKLAERLKLLRVHGSRKKYEYEIVGINSRLDALQAAILRVKLRHLEAWTEGRRRNADRYRALFAEFALTKQVTLPQVPAERTHVYNQFVIRVTERDVLRAFLKERGIPTEIYYPSPLHLERAFQYLGYNAGAFPAAEAASKQVIALPIYPELREEQQRSIVSAIAEFYETL
ncbi:MAG TPA: DegT/DnrJ/EryC1/StrS family aminotransferase [Candidatus Acidoferrales bacterium]|nr:DegT/DnrJ/EryC1/StrS family aminotransferase [Candidatus Acidoferrales bacterium]